MPSAVVGFHHILRGEIHDAGILRQEYRWWQTTETIFRRRRVEHRYLACRAIVPAEGVIPSLREYPARIEGIRRDCAALETTDSVPVVFTDPAVIASAQDTCGSAVLL